MQKSYERGLVRADQPALAGLTRWGVAAAQWGGLAAALTLCYLSTVPMLKIGGVFLFGFLALQRADLALTFVPLTAPLFLVQLRLPGFVPHAVPPHELALFLTTIAVVPRLLVSARHTWPPTWCVPRIGHGLVLLFVVAGVFGAVYVAPEPVARQDALRAFRWFVAEPVIFVALVHWLTVSADSPCFQAQQPLVRQLATSLCASGALVGAWALVQFTGLLLAPHRFLPPISMTYSADVAAGLPRVTSVYGNPNNLGLFLGRVWPIAAALAQIEWRVNERRGWALAYAAAAALCVAGIGVSFSRGAWIGFGAALLVLLVPILRQRFRSWKLAGLLAGSAVLVGIVVLMLALRGNLTGGSANVRLSFWRESLALIAQHPFGLGLDQFYYYHNPVFGRSMIDPALANTLERTAREPHTLLFELWFNLGPLGLLAFGGLVGLAIQRLWQALAKRRVRASALLIQGAVAGLLAALVHGTVDTFYFWPDLAITFWLLLVFVHYDFVSGRPGL